MTASAIEELSTKLVQDAPSLDGDTIESLIAELQEIGSPLALSISRIVELVGDQLVDAGVALPEIADACATLAAGVRGSVDQNALDAARYRVETLQPLPDRPPNPLAAPDVPITKLKRRD